MNKSELIQYVADEAELSRAVDIFEYATAIAVIPLLLAVLDVYSWVRGLSG